ncbi:hypothetical protein [Kitasatospora sp. NBC_01539]|uniref:hypothetical protein n=1 Tax=Kitasatospora sp. NBC_01539 TaxID=2903577 RepID=UPI0038600922
MSDAFLMHADAETTAYFSEVADALCALFGIPRAEAVARLNAQWGAVEFEPYPDLVCHEEPEHWAYLLYHGDVPYWEADADRSAWPVLPPPPAGSAAWTAPPQG